MEGAFLNQGASVDKVCESLFALNYESQWLHEIISSIDRAMQDEFLMEAVSHFFDCFLWNLEF